MASKIRINANVDRKVYQEFRHILDAGNQTVTGFLEECIRRYVREQRYVQDKRAFDELAQESATKDLLGVEKECGHDGLQ